MSDVTLSDLVEGVEAARSHLAALSTPYSAQLDQNAAHAGRLLADGYPVDLHDPAVAAGILAAFKVAGNSYTWWIRRGADPQYATAAFHGVMSSIAVHVAALHRDSDGPTATVERIRELRDATADAAAVLHADDGHLPPSRDDAVAAANTVGYLEALDDVLVLLEGAGR